MPDPTILKLIFGAKAAYLRQQKGLSLQDLSRLTGLSAPYLHEIEKGKKYPKADKIMLIAEALGVPFDELVAVYTSKKLQPIIELLESEWLNAFPLEDMFGLSAAKLLELFANTPDKVNAFISTVIKIARNYQLQTESFYNAALRSYQDLHDNYFSELERAADDFRRQHLATAPIPYTTAALEAALWNTCSIRTERKTLPKNAKLARIRSVFSPTKKTLYLNKNLSTAQQNFLIGRELGFQYLQLSERAYETIIQKAETFDKLLNNFKASYFASALLMNEQEMVHDVYAVAQLSQWDNQLIFRLLKKYDVTPEMLLQRLTNILPRHFDVKDLFFLRIIGSEDLKTFTMDKELHLSQLHSPYANHLQEHYCRRWASLRVLKKLRAHTAPKDTILAEAQISQYWQTDKSYFILSVGKMLSPPNKKSVSVTLGLMITDKLQSLFRFLNPTQRPPVHLPMHTVHTTCERCAISDCNERAVPPVYIERQQELAIIEEEVQKLR